MLSGLKKEGISYPTYIKQNRKKAGYVVVIRCCLFLKNSRIESLCVVPRKKKWGKIIQNCTKEER